MTSDGPRWPGIYAGIVLMNDKDEPRNKHAGKCKVHVPEIHGQNVDAEVLPWALPCFPTPINFNKGAGIIYVPQKDDTVWVMFEGGRVDNPVWIGGYVPSGRIPARARYATRYEYPDAQIIRLADGQMIRLINGRSVEIFAGKDKSETHEEYDTYIKMDLVKKKMEIVSKYNLKIKSDQKLELNAPNIVIDARKSFTSTGKPITSEEGTDADGNPVITPKEGTYLELKCTDASGETGGFSENSDGTYSASSASARIRITPDSIKATAKHVSGFD